MPSFCCCSGQDCLCLFVSVRAAVPMFHSRINAVRLIVSLGPCLTSCSACALLPLPWLPFCWNLFASLDTALVPPCLGKQLLCLCLLATVKPSLRMPPCLCQCCFSACAFLPLPFLLFCVCLSGLCYARVLLVPASTCEC